jgi:hypothetical protein
LARTQVDLAGVKLLLIGVKLLDRSGAGDRTRTYYPIITNDVLYLMSYTGALLCHGPTMALLIFRQALQLTGIARHSRGDPLITNDARRASCTHETPLFRHRP